MRPDAIRDAGLRELGAQKRLHRIAFDQRGNPRPYPERCRLFERYRVELKKDHREMALECHPDRTRDAPKKERHEKEERFKRVTRAVEFLMKIIPRPPTPQRPAPLPTRSQFRARHPGIVIINLGGQPLSMGNFRWGNATNASGVPGSVNAAGSVNANGFVPNYWPWHG